MVNHPNRPDRRTQGKGANPTPDDIRRGREWCGLTIRAAAEVVYASPRAWEDWEGGLRRMHPGLWELFCRKTGYVHSSA